jgi:hypothetical protein
MTDIDQLTKEFMLMCVEQQKRIQPDPSDSQYLQGMIIQLTGKVFQLEARIKELESD